MMRRPQSGCDRACSAETACKQRFRPQQPRRQPPPTARSQQAPGVCPALTSLSGWREESGFLSHDDDDLKALSVRFPHAGPLQRGSALPAEAPPPQPCRSLALGVS
jgi:hypothetical protein